jgi:hypothetical protein
MREEKPFKKTTNDQWQKLSFCFAFFLSLGTRFDAKLASGRITKRIDFVLEKFRRFISV